MTLYLYREATGSRLRIHFDIVVNPDNHLLARYVAEEYPGWEVVCIDVHKPKST